MNKYTYCQNQPVTGYDPDGHFLHILGGALLGGVIGAGASMISQLREKGSIDLRETLGGAAEGAIVGGAAAAGNFVNQWISKGSLSKIDTTQVFTSAAANAMGEVGGKLGESLLKKGGQIAGKFLGTAGKEAAAKAGGSVVQKGLKECFKTGFKCGLGATTYDITKQVASGKGLTDIDWKEVGASAATGFGLGMGAKALANSKIGQKVSSAGEKLSSGLESLKETGKALATNNDGFMSNELMFGKRLTSKLATEGTAKTAEGIDSITSQISKDKPVVAIGESMGRVNPVADELRQGGYEIKTYNPQNFRSSPGNLSRLDVEANRSWLRYWTQKKGATVIDIGVDSSRAARSPFYGVENRSIYQNWNYQNVIKYNPGK